MRKVGAAAQGGTISGLRNFRAAQFHDHKRRLKCQRTSP